MRGLAFWRRPVAPTRGTVTGASGSLTHRTSLKIA